MSSAARTRAGARPDSGRPATPPLAGWWLRVAAYLIDTVLLAMLSALVFLVVWAASGESGTAVVALAITWAATDYLFRGLVYAPLLMRRAGGHNGQTIGKQAARVRVLREDGAPMTYGAAVKREWLARTLLLTVGGALTGGVVTFLDYIWPLWDERKQAFHDKLVKTLVMSVS